MIDAQTIATTIRAQLGGSRFDAMTGARDYIAHDNGLQFRLPQHTAKNKCTHVFVELGLNDLYTVTFQRYNRQVLKMHAISTHRDVSCDHLGTLFTDETGLATSL